MKARRVDSTQSEVVRALERAGCLVLDLSRVGQGCPDLLVYRAGHYCLIECKSKRGRLTPDQEAFMAAGWPVAVCWSAEHALRAAGLVRRKPAHVPF